MKRVLFTFALIVSFNNAAIANNKCFDRAKEAVLYDFKYEWGDLDQISAEIEESVEDNSYGIYQVLTSGYILGPYDGSKSSLYEVEISISGSQCKVESVELLEDYDIAD